MRWSIWAAHRQVACGSNGCIGKAVQQLGWEDSALNQPTAQDLRLPEWSSMIAGVSITCKKFR